MSPHSHAPTGPSPFLLPFPAFLLHDPLPLIRLLPPAPMAAGSSNSRRAAAAATVAAATAATTAAAAATGTAAHPLE